MTGSSDAAAVLINGGTDVNQVDSDSMMPLHNAAEGIFQMGEPTIPETEKFSF